MSEKKLKNNIENDDNLTEKANRITKIRDLFCNGNNTEFATKLQSSTNYTSSLCNGQKSIGEKILNKILSVFPDVNRAWLYFGEGDMLVDGGYMIHTNNQHGNNYQGEHVQTNSELIELVKSQQETIHKQTNQIDRLIAMLEQKI